MYFETTIQAALEFGITSIHDAASEPAIISFMKKYVPPLKYRTGHLYFTDKQTKEAFLLDTPPIIDKELGSS